MLLEVGENRPGLTSFTLATLNKYPVPFLSPVTVTEGAVDATRLNVCQEDPSSLYWTV